MKNANPKDLTGQRFGRLTVKEFAGLHGYFPLWKCLCDCGKERTTRQHSLLNGGCTSCGCAHKEAMVKTRVDLLGKVFGRLTVVRLIGPDKKRQMLWECLCECGNTTNTVANALMKGRVKSCGCYGKEARIKAATEANTIHGISKTLTGVSWTSMMQRCYNPKTIAWPRYGGSGIRPCEFVKASPMNLVVLIGFRSSKDLSLDRIKNKFGYTCGSCQQCIEHGWPMNLRWATRTTQARNRGFVRKMIVDGEEKTLSEISETQNIPMTTLRYRRWKQQQEQAKDVSYDI